MNILPKKRWHVRTKENIARVRRDEAKAAEEAKEQQRRILLAEQETRTELLRKKARENYDGRSDSDKRIDSDVQKSKHINFFEELEEGTASTSGTNKEHEKEKKEEQEKYEKSIGYLTYLGQNTVESTGIKPWYDKIPARLQHDDAEESKSSKRVKLSDDPIKIIHRHVGPSTCTTVRAKSVQVKKKHKKEKKSHHKKHKKHKRKKHRSSSSSEDEKPKVSIEQLRAERLKREQEESLKTKTLLAKLRGESVPSETKVSEKMEPVRQKYNSQFNPHLARQNYEDIK